MNSLSNRELLLKEIVLYMNKNIKKGKKSTQTERANSSYVNLYEVNRDKIEISWPLKKGSVEKSNLAWNFYETNTDVINAFIAFTIKSFAVALKKNKSSFTDEVTSFEKIFSNNNLTSFFWEDIKKYYQTYSTTSSSNKENRIVAVQNLIPHSSCVALCLDSAFFRLRSGANQELSSFEYFIEDLYNANNALIVFSRQKLIQPNKNSLKVNNYSISFKMNKDIIKTSIFEALEPQAHLIQSNRFIEPHKTGCFDRLIDLLTQGQSYIQNLENEFKAWEEPLERTL